MREPEVAPAPRQTVINNDSPPPPPIDCSCPPLKLHLNDSALARAYARLRYDIKTKEGLDWASFVDLVVFPVLQKQGVTTPQMTVVNGADLALVATILNRVFVTRFPKSGVYSPDHLLGILAFPAPPDTPLSHTRHEFLKNPLFGLAACLPGAVPAEPKKGLPLENKAHNGKE